jgi:hypothetical protein
MLTLFMINKQYTIAIKDFISLANYIASHTKTRVEVTPDLVATIDRTIAARKEHFVWNGGDDIQSDERHQYFVGVLEEVRTILRPRMSAEALGRNNISTNLVASAMPPGSRDELANKFKDLAVEEPSDDYLNAPPTPSSSSSPKGPNYQAGLLDQLEEEYFALHCLYKDLNNLRNWISKTWQEYSLGLVGLVAASISTNVALEFARGMSDNLIKSFSKFADAHEAIKTIYLPTCIFRGEDPDCRYRPDDPFNMKMYDVVDCLFIGPFMLLESFLDVLVPGTAPLMKPGYYGVYNPESDREKMSDRGKFNEDKILLLELLPDFYLLCYGKSGAMLSEDEFTRGLRTYFGNKKVSIWLSFAAQIFLDINHLLRARSVTGIFELQRAGQYIEKSIEGSLEFHANLKSPNWVKENEEVVRGLLRQIDGCIKTCSINKAKKKLSGLVSKPFTEFPT